MSQQKPSQEVIVVPERAIVHEHKESGAKYTAFAFVFPDGVPATLVITKGTRSKWTPSKDIDNITIQFNEN